MLIAQIEIGKSNQLFLLALLVYTLTSSIIIGILSQYPQDSIWGLPLLIAVVYHGYYILGLHVTRHHPNSLCQCSFFPHNNSWQLSTTSGNVKHASLLEHSVCTTAFVLLNFKGRDNRKTSVLIWHDAISNNDFRQLRYCLYQVHGEDNE